MGFLEAISSVLANSLNFGGRASRSEYWYWSLFITLLWFSILTFIFMTTSVHFPAHNTPFSRAVYVSDVLKPYMSFLTTLALLIILPNLSGTVRRLHDIGRSGWWFFISLLPYVGFLILLYWTLLPSQRDSNKWGGNPSGDNGTSGLKDIYDNAVANATRSGASMSQTYNNVMDSSVGRNSLNQQRTAISSAPVTFGKR